MIYWRKFAFKMKEDGNDTIYLAMKKRDPKLAADFVIIHEVDNQVQIDYIQTHITDLIDYLRENLNNWGISLQFSITESEEENIKFQTGKDKFTALARKNPNLHTLQKLFNLDIEY
jgi:DNA polymerase-3 subunit gamma/tau